MSWIECWFRGLCDVDRGFADASRLGPAIRELRFFGVRWRACSEAAFIDAPAVRGGFILDLVGFVKLIWAGSELASLIAT